MKPLWALAGTALLGTAGVAGAIVVTSPGGEEEVVQQVQTISPTPTSAPTVTPSQAPSPTAIVTPSPAPTPEPTSDGIPADWPTYTDPVLGFSLRYPPDLAFRDLTGPDAAQQNQRALDFRSPMSPPPRGFTLATYTNPEGLSPETWARRNTACLPDTIKQTTAAGAPAISCTAQATEIPNAAVLFEHMGSMYHIGSLLTSAEFDSLLASLRL